VRLTDFTYDLPPELIAQRPLAERSASRLLFVPAEDAAPRDLAFADLPQLLRAGDLLVFNDTRVVPARIAGRKPTGGRVEILLERACDGGSALVHVKGGKALRPGLGIETEGGTVRVLGREGELWRVALPLAPLEFFTLHGQVPLPPYITRVADAADRERYQSLLARVPGAVAAPTASLHFDAPLLERLEAAGLQRALVTLHVGAGTFQPIRSDDPLAHRMHKEFIDVPAATCAAIERTRAAGGRVVAIGTTVARALESAAAGGALRPFSGDTDIYIRPGHDWRVVDALVTNFHLPHSTLLVLVSAFAGRERVLAAYRHAVAQRYRFFSYGDAMFLTRAADPA
jgi:S-adenosylmethionine:tRNA ribosyltransferase-isomerase